MAVVGKRVLSYPDHSGNPAEGIITEVMAEGITVRYGRYGTIALSTTGKMSERIDTAVDIGLIER